MSFGKMAVDWEQRVDFDKLRKDRLANANKAMKEYGIGTAIIYDWDMQRYVSSYWAHPYARHHPHMFHLLFKDAGHPYITIGANDLVHQPQTAPWLKDKFVSDGNILENAGVRHYLPDDAKQKKFEKIAGQIKALMNKHRVMDLAVSIDYGSPYMAKALEKEGMKVLDGNNWELEARVIKTPEEIELLRMAATCIERGYTELARVLRPGMRENDCRGIMMKAAAEAGAEYEEGWVNSSGPRGSPKRYNWSDRMIRAGEMFSIEQCHVTYCGYKNCMSRIFMVGAKPNQMQKEIYDQIVYLEDRAIKMLKPGASCKELGKAARKIYDSIEDMKKYRNTLQLSNHQGGMGISHGELPYIGGMNEPGMPDRKLEPGMVVAYALTAHIKKPGAPLNDEWAGAGGDIENTVVITETGNEMLTIFPWREMMICGYPGQLYGDKLTDQLNVTVD